MHTACGFLFIWLSIIIARLNCKHPSECGSGWYILVVVERGWGGRAGVAAANCGSTRLWSACLAAPLHSIRLWCGGLIILDILLYTVLWTCDLSLTGGGNYQVGESKATLYFPYIYLHTFFMLVKGNASSAEQGNAIFSTYIYTQICTLYTIIVCFFALLFSRLNTHDTQMVLSPWPYHVIDYIGNRHKPVLYINQKSIIMVVAQFLGWSKVLRECIYL